MGFNQGSLISGFILKYKTQEMNDKLTILFRIPQLKLFKQPVRLRIMILHSDEGLFLRSMLIMFIFLFGSGSLKCHAQGNASQKL